jgi:hypothetical protein
MKEGGDSAMKATTLINAPVLLLLVSTLSAQTGGTQANATPWELADPNAKVLIGIDVRGLRESDIGKSISAQMDRETATPPIPFKIPGIELLSDIDSVFISSTGELPAKKPAAPKTAASNTPPFLLVASGTFPDDHLRSLLAGKHPSYKAFNIYGSANGANIAVLDEHTIVFGDTKSIRAAIDRRGLKTVAAVTPVFERAKELAATNDFWMVAKDTASSLKQATGANPFTSEIDGLEVGAQLREGLDLDLNLATKTEAAAGMFAQLLSAQIQSAIATKADDPAVAELVKKLQVGSQGNRMTVHLALTQEEMEHSMKVAQAARANAGVRQTATAAPKPQAPPVPAGPRKVRIYGLDEGVREITLDPQP